MSKVRFVLYTMLIAVIGATLFHSLFRMISYPDKIVDLAVAQGVKMEPLNKILIPLLDEAEFYSMLFGAIFIIFVAIILSPFICQAVSRRAVKKYKEDNRIIK